MQKLAEGARKLGINLTPSQLERFEAYYRLLTAANERVNLTAITAYDEVQVSHFLDSLTLLPLLPPAAGIKVIDVGSGGGLPGLPLKLARPDIRLALLDATAKKAALLREFRDALGLENVDVIGGRAEAVAREPEHREAYDVALSRAVAPLAVLAELCLSFCKVGGVCLAQKKGDIAAELAAAQKAITLLGGQLREVRPVALDEFADGRCLVVVDKVSPTPPAYPRRAGMPKKRPLG